MYVVAVAIDKVQTFLYQVIHTHTQEHRSNKGTLKNIIHASDLISTNFYQDIENEFTIASDHKVLKCSGVYIFGTDLPGKEIESRLGKIFLKYYKDNNGQLVVKYVYEQASISDNASKLQAIKKYKAEIKRQACLNQIVKKHAEQLFQFCAINEAEEKIQMTKYPSLLSSVDELCRDEDPDQEDNPNRFRIAVIKADFDGMGALFKGLEDYKDYRNISEILNNWICLKKLNYKVGLIKKKNSKFKLYPIYIAGDDIFFAVHISNLKLAIEKICREILQGVNNAIQIALSNKPNIPCLSLSVGVDFTFNREPIRYYYERVEEQLSNAKDAENFIDKELIKSEKINHMKISINNYILYDWRTFKPNVKLEFNNEEKLQWMYFISVVKHLKYFDDLLKKENCDNDEQSTVNHFLYTLLRKATETQGIDDECKYSNAILYHLLPRYIEHPNKEIVKIELCMIEKILQVVTIQNTIGEKTQKELSFSIDKRKQLERYIRLLLLFLDARFSMSNLVKINEKEIKKNSLFNRILRYLHRKSLEGSGLFIVDDTYQPKEDKDTNPSHVYRTLRIKNSMFYRMKKVYENSGRESLDSIADMLEATCHTKERIEELEKQRGEHKAPPNLPFDIDEFKKWVKGNSCWNEDYIDSLLVFYQYNQSLIDYKTRYGKKEAEAKK